VVMGNPVTRPAILLHRIVCKVARCELDEIYLILTGHRRCLHCRKALRPPTVGELNSSVGD
jgi:hypothetical protein